MNIEDQIGNLIKISKTPQRIISLVPSQTELLFHLGLDKQIAGITNFCILPENETKNKLKIGGTKNIDIEKIKNLNPDLIIAGKEENDKSSIIELKKYAPVWVSDVKDYGSAIDMIKHISIITGKREKGMELISEIQNEVKNFKSYRFKKHKVLYFIWRNPYMVAGGDTFINSMIEMAGFTNEAKMLNRYPMINKQNKHQFNPEFILLCSEPYRFSQNHLPELKELFPDAKIVLTDGQLFAWYGSRLKYAFKYFKKLRKEIEVL